MATVEEILSGLSPVDRRALVAAFMAGARIESGVLVEEVLHSLPPPRRSETRSAISALMSHEPPLLVEWGAKSCFLTPIGLQCVVRLQEEAIDEPLPDVPALPFLLSNDSGRPWRAEARFLDDIDFGDGRIEGALESKMKRILEAPETTGKRMHYYHDGRRTCQVTKNKRLIYRQDGDTVVFMRFMSREDPDYT